MAPTAAAEGDLVLVGDVRLVNRYELLATLGLQADDCDDRLALSAYERWGTSCLDHLAGSYALAIVDRRRGGVFLGRDHIGDRPLVMYQRARVVAFASNALAMTGFAGVGHNLDEVKATEMLAYTYSTDRTLVADVRWLPAGHAMWMDSDGTRTWRWWQTDPTDVDDLGSLQAHADVLRDSFDTAVEACLRGGCRIGAQVSGGLDSTSVAATAAKMVAPDFLPVYTSVPRAGWSAPATPGLDYDESPLVRDLVRRVPNLVPHWIQSQGSKPFDGARAQALWERGAVPPFNPCNLMWLTAIDDQAASDGVDVLLSGTSGNLAFSADGPDWLVALARARRPVGVARAARAWAEHKGLSLPSVLRSHLLGPLAPAALRRLLRPGVLRNERSDWAAEIALRAEILDLVERSSYHPELGQDHVDHRLMLWAAIDSQAGHAETGAAIDVVSGIEHRDPTADRRVMEVAASQPEWTRRSGGYSRAVVRTAMASRLPESIAWRRQRGAQFPDWLEWLTSARGELTRDVTAMYDHPLSRRLFDVDRLAKLVANWPRQDLAVDEQTEREYRSALLRAVDMSRYLRWFEDRARSSRRDLTGSTLTSDQIRAKPSELRRDS